MEFNFRSVCASISFCVAVMASSSANAVLVSIDLAPGSGDNLVTRDTDSDLDWLDVPLTSNQTYDQVRTGTYYRQGFRHATVDELKALFINAGLLDDGFDIGVTQPTQALALIALLGATIADEKRSSTIGFTGNDYFGEVVTNTNYPINTRFSALTGKIDYLDLRDSGLYLIGEAHFTGGHPFSDEANPAYGSFLVRDACRTAGRSPNPKCNGQAKGQYN